jgi:hypothetical protein
MQFMSYDGNLTSIDYLDFMILDIYGTIRSVTIPTGSYCTHTVAGG